MFGRNVNFSTCLENSRDESAGRLDRPQGRLIQLREESTKLLTSQTSAIQHFKLLTFAAGQKPTDVTIDIFQWF